MGCAESGLVGQETTGEWSNMTTLLYTTKGREMLKLALLLPDEERSRMAEVHGRGGGHGDPMPIDPIYTAAYSIGDPAKLVEFIVFELRVRGVGELVWEGDPHTADVWHDNSQPDQAITIRWWIGIGRDRGVWHMSEARAKLLAIMATPLDESSCEACMVIVRGRP